MKGNVIAHLGGKWTGIELRKQQVIHNNNKAFNGAKWICDTGENITKHIDYNSADMILSCPPYFNLEVYSELENDISNAKSYDIFINSLRKMYVESIKCLKNDSFACIVIQNIRKVKSKLYIDYYPFKEDVIKIFTENGMFFYNDIVILKSNGTAQMRAIPYMNQKKIVPIHEYLLVFYKGNFKNIKYKFK
jgi:DNA modification methylase